MSRDVSHGFFMATRKAGRFAGKIWHLPKISIRLPKIYLLFWEKDYSVLIRIIQ